MIAMEQKADRRKRLHRLPAQNGFKTVQSGGEVNCRIPPGAGRHLTDPSYLLKKKAPMTHRPCDHEKGELTHRPDAIFNHLVAVGVWSRMKM
jgi:hypothetical protein